MSVFPGTPEPGLTDAELRASPVPVTGTVTANTGGLTNNELRGSPVPVSVSNLPGTQPVSGTVTATQATASNLKAQAQIIDSAGSTVSYAEIGTAGTPSADVVSVQGVSGGVAIPVSLSGVATSANQTTANTSLSSIDGKLPALSSGRVPVDIGGNGSITITSGTVTVSNEVEVTNDTGSPIPVSGTVSSKVAGWDIPLHDYRALGYTSGNLTSVTYKTGGAGGTTVATLTLGYDGSGNLTSLTKT